MKVEIARPHLGGSGAGWRRACGTHARCEQSCSPQINRQRGTRSAAASGARARLSVGLPDSICRIVPAKICASVASSYDRAGVRVAVGRGSAYDLFLTRKLEHVQLVRVPTSAEAMGAFLRDHLDVARA